MIIKLFIRFNRFFVMIDIDNKLYVYDCNYVKLMDGIPLNANIIKMNFIGEILDTDEIILGFLDDAFNYRVYHITDFKNIKYAIIPDVKMYHKQYILCKDTIYYSQFDELQIKKVANYDPYSFIAFDNIVTYNINGKKIIEDIVLNEKIEIDIHDEIIKDIFYIDNCIFILTKDGNIYTQLGKLNIKNVTSVLLKGPDNFLYMSDCKMHWYKNNKSNVVTGYYLMFDDDNNFINDKNELITHDEIIIDKNVKFTMKYYARGYNPFVDLDNYAHTWISDKISGTYIEKISREKVYKYINREIININSQSVNIATDSIVFRDCYLV